MKKILSVLLSVLMILSIMPMSIFAAETGVAKIDETYYATLQEAVDAATDGAEVILLADITVNAEDDKPETQVWVKEGKSVTIDLNGFTITGAVYVNGTATLKNGSIINENMVSGIESKGNLTLENMTVTSDRHGVRISGGTATFISGTYQTVGTSGTRHAVNASGGAVVNVKGGTFIGAGYADLGGSGNCLMLNGASANIEGGEFYGANGVEGPICADKGLVISGGSFEDKAVTSFRYHNYLADGKVAVVNSVTGYYDVADAEAKIVDTYYATLADAIEAATSGDTIDVLAAEIELPTITVAGLTFKAKGTKITNSIPQTNSDYGWRIEGTTFEGFEFTQQAAFVGKDLTFEKCKFTGPNGLYYGAASGTWTIENCEFSCWTYNLQFGSDLGGIVNVNNCVFNGGFNTFGTEVNFTDCTFNKSLSSYSVVQTRKIMTFTDCTFAEDWKADINNVGVANSDGVVEYYNTTYTGGSLFDLMEDKSVGTVVINPVKNSEGLYIGGTFASAPKADKLAEGYVPVANEDGTYGVEPEAPEYVAEAGGVQYTSLQTAVDSANGEEITLLKDITVAAEDDKPETQIWVKEGVTAVIDFNGMTINGAVYVNGTATLKNGSIINENMVSGIESKGNLTLENMTVTSDRHGVRISGGTATFISGTYQTVGTSGTRHAVNASGGAVVNIKGGTFIGAGYANLGGKGNCLMLNGASANIEGGEFYGANGVEGPICADKGLVISGGSFEDKAVTSFRYHNYLADGKVAVLNADGMYEVVETAAKIGDTYYATLADAIAAAGDGAIIEVFDGTHKMPRPVVNKEIILKGSKNAIIDMTEADGRDQNHGAIITFEGLTVNFTENTGHYPGFSHATKIAYKDCVINGRQFLYAPTEFIDCTFNNKKDYCVWTYGSNNTIFTNCTFNTGGKAILVYAGGEFEANVILDNCKFYSDASLATNKAAVEVGSDDMLQKYTIVFTNCTADENFVENNTSSNLIGNKNSVSSENLTVVDTPETDESGLYTGGIFYTKPSDSVIAEGYVAVENSDGTYSIEVEPEEYMSKFYYTKGYVPSTKDPEEFPYAILFAVGIDSLDYVAGGFEVSVSNGASTTLFIDGTVWTKLTVRYADRTDVLTPQNFGENCKYIMYYICTFPDEWYDANYEITVNAFLQEENGGEKIYPAKEFVTTLQ